MAHLRTPEGLEIGIGDDSALDAALRDMSAATGGSSARGQWSRLFGLASGDVLTSELAAEAEDLDARVGHLLQPETKAVLRRLTAAARDDGVGPTTTRSD
jgi:hypothetical protein